MQRIFTHPDLPTSIVEVKLIKGIGEKWLIFISDKFGVVTCFTLSAEYDSCPGDIPPDGDLLSLALLHTKYSIESTSRN